MTTAQQYAENIRAVADVAGRIEQDLDGVLDHLATVALANAVFGWWLGRLP